MSSGDLRNWSDGSSTWRILLLWSLSWNGESKSTKPNSLSSHLMLKLSGMVDWLTFLFHYICLHDFEHILVWLMFCISLQIFRYSSKIARHGTKFQVLSWARTTKLQFHCCKCFLLRWKAMHCNFFLSVVKGIKKLKSNC